MATDINISMLVRKEWRTAAGMARIKAIATSLAMDISAEGKVSLSAKMSRDSFIHLFHITPTEVKPQLPGKWDYGSAGGYTSETELEVPEQLKEFIDTISIPPPASRLL